MAATTSDSVTRDVNGLMTSNCARRRPENVSSTGMKVKSTEMKIRPTRMKIRPPGMKVGPSGMKIRHSGMRMRPQIRPGGANTPVLPLHGGLTPQCCIVYIVFSLSFCTLAESASCTFECVLPCARRVALFLGLDYKPRGRLVTGLATCLAQGRTHLSLGTETLRIDKLCALMAATTSDSVTRDVNGLMTSNCARRRPENVSCALCQQ